MKFISMDSCRSKFVTCLQS